MQNTHIQAKRRAKDAPDVLENIRFEDAHTLGDKEADSLAQLYEIKMERGGKGDRRDEYEILSIYSCNECVMHEGSSNKVQFSISHFSKKIPSEMGVAPLYNPFNPLIHNLFKNFKKFKM